MPTYATHSAWWMADHHWIMSELLGDAPGPGSEREPVRSAWADRMRSAADFQAWLDAYVEQARGDSRPAPPDWLDSFLTESAWSLRRHHGIEGLAGVGSLVGGWAAADSPLDLVIFAKEDLTDYRPILDTLISVEVLYNQPLRWYFRSPAELVARPRSARLVFAHGRLGGTTLEALVGRKYAKLYGGPIEHPEVVGLYAHRFLSRAYHVRTNAAAAALAIARLGQVDPRTDAAFVANELHHLRKGLQGALLTPRWLAEGVEDPRPPRVALEAFAARVRDERILGLSPWAYRGGGTDNLGAAAFNLERIREAEGLGVRLYDKLLALALQHPAVLLTMEPYGARGFRDYGIGRYRSILRVANEDLKSHARDDLAWVWAHPTIRRVEA